MHIAVLLGDLALEVRDVLLLHFHVLLHQLLVLLVLLHHQREEVLLALLGLGQLFLVVRHDLIEIDHGRLWMI